MVPWAGMDRTMMTLDEDGTVYPRSSAIVHASFIVRRLAEEDNPNTEEELLLHTRDVDKISQDCIKHPNEKVGGGKEEGTAASARSGTSTGRASKGSKDDALDRAMESHHDDMERYFKMKEEHHVKDAELRRLELQQQIAHQEIRKQKLEFEQHKFDPMQAN
eukprot:CAMPEP_0117678254 /NCGR_PEP_ID=MMETSP0804-20121206/17198_1 /TAXON_ID=1074897 /ORGANISM="Tetraselmis astigmatica, Strain CCMP880" /LENGTH=161 /DNA_ID=CAMNT_0005487627 /DNA_START=66 /DNA_END=552 /DNA_ORIENTATION=+